MVTPNTLPGGARNPDSAPTGHVTEESSVGATAEDSSVVPTDGLRQESPPVRHYDLDAVVSVGFRVDSQPTGRPLRRTPEIPATIRFARAQLNPKPLR